jgi:amino acid adenylation domain-containing protein
VRALTIHGLLSRSAEIAGERSAAIDRGRSISYAELDAESNRLAHALSEHGVAPGDRVGLLIDKSLEALIGIYGILKAGATYVPLDDQAPIRRLAYIARDAEIRCLISACTRAGDWERMTAEGAPLETVVAVGDRLAQAAGLTILPWSSLTELPAGSLERDEDPDALAYILYTSGSTGEPKGVMLSHRNGLAFVDWAAQEVGVGPEDRLSSHAPFHFDLSTFDLFAAAWAAATVVLVPREASIFPIALAGFIREQLITVWYSVPSILTQLVLRGELDKNPLSALRAVIFAGEVFPTKYLSRLIELVPQARYLNFFGPTETNVCTWYEVPRGDPLGEPLPIGRPIAGVQASVRRPDGTRATAGEAGELVVRGPTVMHGYWGDPDRTAAALHYDGDERAYRTGDLVSEQPDGTLLFLGRRDAQVKTRGYRVELGEIEAALNSLPLVVECAVVAIADDAITNRLRAFVVTREPVTVAALAGACRALLPSYMIPDEFEFRPTLPKSTTGKVDRRQLSRQIDEATPGRPEPR